MGGFDGSSEQGGVVDVYETGSKTWQSISFSPDGIRGPGARSVAALLPVRIAGAHHLLTMFGEADPSSSGHAGAGKMLGDVWVFTITEPAWSRVIFEGAAPAPRGWFAADVLHRDDGVVIHGGLAEDNSRLGDVWKLSKLSLA
jgi:hypothetical protein